MNSCSESVEGDFDQQWGQNHIIWSLPDFEGGKKNENSNQTEETTKIEQAGISKTK